MKKKIVSALMVAAMVVTAFAGCGSDKRVDTSTQGWRQDQQEFWKGLHVKL